MTAADGATPRLNPLAFVSDTSLRFILLLVIVVGATIQRWNGMAVVWFHDLTASTKPCFAGSPILRGVVDDEAVSSLATCLHGLAVRSMSSMVAGLVLLALTTALIYATYPFWTIRRLRLERLDPSVSWELQNTLEELCRTAGLRRMPEFWWNPLDGRPAQAITFGTGRRPIVGFSGKLALRYFNDSPGFRAIILHELAHIRNRDIVFTYLAISLGWAFLISTLLPYAALEATEPNNVMDIAFVMADIGVQAACVLLVLNALLRAVELSADARSLSWHRQWSPLGDALRLSTPAPRWRALLSSHPEPKRRLQLAENTDQMFQFGQWDAFGVGIGAGFAAFCLFAFISSAALSVDVTGSSATSLLAPFFAALLIVPITTAAIAVGAWRSAFLRLMRGGKGTSKLRIAFSCACGLALYGLILPTTIVLESSAGFGSAADMFPRIQGDLAGVFTAGALICALLLVALTVSLVLLLAVVESIALAWLAVSLPGRKPGATFTIGLWLCSVAAAIWSVIIPLGLGAVISVMHERSMSGPIAAFWTVTLLATSSPIEFFAWPSTVAIWALPLSASLFKKRSPNAETWAFEPGQTAPLPLVPLSPKRAIAAGLGCGLIAAATMVWLRIPLTPDAMAGSGLPTVQAAADLTSHVLSGMAAVALTAMVVAMLTPALPVVHATCAGFFASIIIALGAILHLHLRLTGSTIAVSDYLWMTFSPIVISGSVAGLAGATIGRCIAPVATSASFGWRRLRIFLSVQR